MYRLSVCFQSVCGGVAPETRWRTSTRVRPRCYSSSMPSSSSSLRSGSLSTWHSTATSWSAGTRSGPHRACPQTWRWPPFWFSSECSQSHPLGLLVWLIERGLFLSCRLVRRDWMCVIPHPLIGQMCLRKMQCAGNVTSWCESMADNGCGLYGIGSDCLFFQLDTRLIPSKNDPFLFIILSRLTE